MEHLKNTVSGIIHSESVRMTVQEIGESTLGIFLGEPISGLKLIGKLVRAPATIRDGIFFECLQTFFQHTYRFNPSTNSFEASNLKALAEALAEASPNAAADYAGNPEKLKEYAKRLIKTIDDCGTNQKAVYLASLARAVLSHQIDTKKFFQLSNCIRTLTEEDLSFLHDHIQAGVHVEDTEEYIGDYCALRLMYEAHNGKYTYSKRAFELKKYCLAYEEHFSIPETFPEKATKLLIG